MRQLQVVQQYLSHSHEHLRSFHTAVVAPYRYLNINSSITTTIIITWSGYLKDTATIPLMKDQLLLEKRIQRPAGSRGFRLGQTFLPADEINLHPGRRQDLGARLALEATGSDDLNLEVSSLVDQTELDVPEDGRAEDLPAHQLAGPEAGYELV